MSAAAPPQPPPRARPQVATGGDGTGGNWGHGASSGATPAASASHARQDLEALCRRFGIRRELLLTPGRYLVHAVTVPGSKEDAQGQAKHGHAPGTDELGRRTYHVYVLSDVVLLIKEAPASALGRGATGGVGAAAAAASTPSGAALTHHAKWLDYNAFTVRNNFDLGAGGAPLRVCCRSPEVTYVLWCEDDSARDELERAIDDGRCAAFTPVAQGSVSHDDVGASRGEGGAASPESSLDSPGRARSASDGTDGASKPIATTPPWLGARDRSVAQHLEDRIQRVRGALGQAMGRRWAKRPRMSVRGVPGAPDGVAPSRGTSMSSRAEQLLSTLEALNHSRRSAAARRASRRNSESAATAHSSDGVASLEQLQLARGAAATAAGARAAGAAGTFGALREMLEVDVDKYGQVPQQNDAFVPIDKESKRRYRIYQEIIETERVYVRDLQTLITLYMLPLMRAAESKSQEDIVPASAIPTIFSNIEVLLCVNTELLLRLCTPLAPEAASGAPAAATNGAGNGSAGAGGAGAGAGDSKQPEGANGEAGSVTSSPPAASDAAAAGEAACATDSTAAAVDAAEGVGSGAANGSSPLHGTSHARAESHTSGSGGVDGGRLSLVIATAFRDMMPYLRMYFQYCKNFHTALARVKQEKESNPAFAGFLQYNEKQPRAGGKDIGSFLIKPVQRICKYQLFFGDLLRHMAPDHPSRASVQETADTVRRIASEVNSRISQSEQDAKMVDLHARLGGRLRLVKAHRHLEMEESAVGFGTFTDKSVLHPKPGAAALCDSLGGHKQLQLFLLTDLLLIAKTSRGLLNKQPRVKLAHRFDLASVIALDDKPIVCACGQAKGGESKQMFGAVLRVDARLGVSAGKPPPSATRKASRAKLASQDVAGFIVWFDSLSRAQAMLSRIASTAEVCRTTAAALEARRSRAISRVSTGSTVRKFAGRRMGARSLSSDAGDVLSAIESRYARSLHSMELAGDDDDDDDDDGAGSLGVDHIDSGDDSSDAGADVSVGAGGASVVSADAHLGADHLRVPSLGSDAWPDTTGSSPSPVTDTVLRRRHSSGPRRQRRDGSDGSMMSGGPVKGQVRSQSPLPATAVASSDEPVAAPTDGAGAPSSQPPSGAGDSATPADESAPAAPVPSEGADGVAEAGDSAGGRASAASGASAQPTNGPATASDGSPQPSHAHGQSASTDPGSVQLEPIPDRDREPAGARDNGGGEASGARRKGWLSCLLCSR